MLGPFVRLSGVTARVTYPGEPGQETCWHIHRRVIPEPLPPWLAHPHTLDCLCYLDETDDATGPVVVVPGTHKTLHEQPAPDDVGDKDGQVVLRLPDGSVVFMHSNLWHRGMPTTPGGHRRRLLIVGYAPGYFRDTAYGTRPADGLSRPVREGDDPAAKELFGIGGWV